MRDNNTFKLTLIGFVMIVVDIETSGGDFEKCGILEIGAVDLFNPNNTFFEEARLGEEHYIINEKKFDKTVLQVLGKTEEELRDKKKQTERELIEHFLKWCDKIKIKNFICFHPQFDYSFIWQKTLKYNLELPVSHRNIDLHSVAILKYLQINKEFPIKADKLDFGLKRILEFVGMTDERGAHNALEDAKLEAEAIFRIFYGKNLLDEYKKYKIPDYLINN